jgi:hypothetical protein
MRSVLLLCGLCGVLAGCSWTGSGAASSLPHIGGGPRVPLKASLTIQIRALAKHGSKLVHSRSLECPRVGEPGSYVVRACSALRDYVQHFRQPTSSCGCGAVRLGTRFAVVRGTVNGRPFKAEYSYCMCGFEQRLIRDLRTVSGLRSFAPAATH